MQASVTDYSQNGARFKKRRSLSAGQAEYVEWRHWLETDGWLTPNTYGREYADFGNFAAVYLFVTVDIGESWDFRVSYVGMSTNLLQRMTGHPIFAEVSAGGGYVQRWFKPTPREKLRETERQYIRRFNPPWNISGKARGVIAS